jgi:hypothetical protein
LYFKSSIWYACAKIPFQKVQWFKLKFADVLALDSCYLLNKAGLIIKVYGGAIDITISAGELNC